MEKKAEGVGGLSKKHFMDGLMGFAEKIGSNIYIGAVSKGMMQVMPIIIVGSLAVLLLALPVPALQAFWKNTGLNAVFYFLNSFSLGIYGVLVAFAVANALAEKLGVSGSFAGILSLVTYLVFVPTNVLADGVTSAVPFTWLGSTGLFVAIMIALLVTKIYSVFLKKKITIRMPESVPDFVSNSFVSLIPTVVILFGAGLIRYGLALTSFETVFNLIFSIVQAPFQRAGGTLASQLLYSVVAMTFWSLGVHTSAFSAIWTPIWAGLDAANLAAAAAGTVLPNIVGRAFDAVYASMNPLPIAILLCFLAKSKKNKVLGKMALPAAIFGIGEPIVFGLPIIFNPIYAIPFVLAKAVNVLIAYAVTAIGIVPRLLGAATPFGVPIVFSGLLQGSWKVAVLQVVLLLIDIAIWYPFFKAGDRMALIEESREG